MHLSGVLFAHGSSHPYAVRVYILGAQKRGFLWYEGIKGSFILSVNKMISGV